MIYLDNNATTMMPDVVKQSMINWCNKGNPSSNYASAKAAKAMIDAFRGYIGKLCGFNQHGSDAYKIIFTSSASEANCTIVHSIITSYNEITSRIPHVIISTIEHKSLLDMVKSYEMRKIIEVTYVGPSVSGHIHPDDVKKAIRPNSCLVCVMHANNETGAINDIQQIGSIAHSNNIPYHSDTSQTFGKFPVSPLKQHIDSFCISFHKLHGPPGVGALIIKQRLYDGHRLKPIIYGAQNEGMRGGTENVPGLGASYTALQYTMADRQLKNSRLLALKTYIISKIAERIPTRQYISYLQSAQKLPEIEIIFLSGNNNHYLPNTILLSVVKRSKPPICNRALRDELEKNNIIVSVGSACNTSSPNASHVLYAIHADELIRRGALRITLGDETTSNDAEQFIRVFVGMIKKYNCR
jgi:cysteine desulfurase